jgi:tripartite ATP-independent transporter DctP family solute receptor
MRGITLKKLFTAALILCLASVFMAGCSGKKETGSTNAAKVKVMKMTSVNTKDRPLTIGLDKFAEIVAKETGGAIKVEVYSDSVLGGERQILEGVQMGTIQGGLISTAVSGTVVPRAMAFDLPFLFKDKQTAFKVLDGPIGQEVLKELPGKKVIGFAYWDSGFRHLTNSKKEVTTLADLEGLKVRTMESKVHVDTWKMLGVNPTPMSFNQLYSALEQKVVDGQENPWIITKTNKINEVQKYMTNTGHVYGSLIFVVSKVFWDTLTDKEKEIITKAELQARAFERELNEKQDNECLKDLIASGMKVSELAPGEKEKIVQKLQPVYKDFAATIGGDFVDRLLAAVK